MITECDIDCSLSIYLFFVFVKGDLWQKDSKKGEG